MKTAKIVLMVIFIGLSISFGQDRSTDYEFWFHTKNVSAGTTVTFRVQTDSIPRWNEHLDLASGTSTVYRTRTGSTNLCTQPETYVIDKGGGDSPSIGWVKHKVDITNTGMDAYFYMDCWGADFQGDKYFTYDGNTDRFYLGGGCGSYGTTSIANGSRITIDDDDGSGNLAFQPTNPIGLTVVSNGGHPYLSWTASEPSFSTKTYKIERKEYGGSWSQIASGVSSTNYTDYDIDTSTAKDRKTWYYRVRAYTSKNSPGYSNEAYILGVLDLNFEAPTEHTINKLEVQNDDIGLLTNPNPFNPITDISFNAPEAADVNISIYNALGEESDHIQIKNVNIGHNQIQWSGINSPSGIYLIYIEAIGINSGKVYSDNTKMHLLK